MISAIILAAGQATRFGQCKQLTRLGDKTVLQHTLDHVNQSNVDDVVVVLGAHADEIRHELQTGRARIVLNPDYDLGMSTSIHAGLRSLPGRTEAVMIVLADQPFVASQTFSLLCDEYRRVRAPLVIPTYNGIRGNPVIIDKTLFPEIMAIRGDSGCRSIFGDHADAIATIPVDDQGILIDIDTKDDLERAPA